MYTLYPASSSVFNTEPFKQFFGAPENKKLTPEMLMSRLLCENATGDCYMRRCPRCESKDKDLADDLLQICLQNNIETIPFEVWEKSDRTKIERKEDTAEVHPHSKKTPWFWNWSLPFNPQYLCQFLVKSSNQGQFWNLLVLAIQKQFLVARFDNELMELLKVKEKTTFFELSSFIWARLYIDIVAPAQKWQACQTAREAITSIYFMRF